MLASTITICKRFGPKKMQAIKRYEPNCTKNKMAAITIKIALGTELENKYIPLRTVKDYRRAFKVFTNCFGY